jgi:ElaB/YqjD/DUF883 family membrane-anchored ribosome-binding protein
MSETHKASHPDADEVFASNLSELKESFNQLRLDMNDLVKSVVESGHSGANAARAKAAGAVKGVQHKIADMKDAGNETLESLGDRIAERPLTSTLIALTAGFILAKWMSRD